MAEINVMPYIDGESLRGRIEREKQLGVEETVGIVRDENARIYIQQRDSDAMLGGLWEFPGGKVEAGESPEEACRRCSSSSSWPILKRWTTVCGQCFLRDSFFSEKQAAFSCLALGSR